MLKSSSTNLMTAFLQWFSSSVKKASLFIGGISSRAGKSSLILSNYSLTLRKFHAELYYLLEKSPYKFIDSIRPYSRLHRAYSRSRRYKYKWGCAYSFCQIFQGLCLLKGVLIFQTLEYCALHFFFFEGKWIIFYGIMEWY